LFVQFDQLASCHLVCLLQPSITLNLLCLGRSWEVGWIYNPPVDHLRASIDTQVPYRNYLYHKK